MARAEGTDLTILHRWGYDISMVETPAPTQPCYDIVQYQAHPPLSCNVVGAWRECDATRALTDLARKCSGLIAHPTTWMLLLIQQATFSRSLTTGKPSVFASDTCCALRLVHTGQTASSEVAPRDLSHRPPPQGPMKTSPQDSRQTGVG